MTINRIIACFNCQSLEIKKETAYKARPSIGKMMYYRRIIAAVGAVCVCALQEKKWLQIRTTNKQTQTTKNCKNVDAVFVEGNRGKGLLDIYVNGTCCCCHKHVCEPELTLHARNSNIVVYSVQMFKLIQTPRHASSSHISLIKSQGHSL